MNARKEPSLIISLIPLITMALFLGVGYGVFQIKAEILLIGSATVAGLLAKFLGYNWKELEQGIVESVCGNSPGRLKY